MTYTQLAVLALVAAVAVDVLALRTLLVRRRVFWTSYAIMFSFQLLTNAVLTGAGVVRYEGGAILGPDVPADAAPPFIGAGRLAYAPVEDVFFGFALILLTLSWWVWLGRKGLQREPVAGPPRRRRARDSE